MANESLEISDKEFAAVTQLDAAARYRHFLKRVADWQEAWSLYEDGWMTMHDDEGRLLLPLWPARRYAEAHRLPGWGEAAEARSISLDRLLENWLPGLKADGRGVSIFPVAGKESSIQPSLDDFERDLRAELERYGED